MAGSKTIVRDEGARERMLVVVATVVGLGALGAMYLISIVLLVGMILAIL